MFPDLAKPTQQGEPQAAPQPEDAAPKQPSPEEKLSRSELIQQFQEEALQHPKKLFACMDAMTGGAFNIHLKVEELVQQRLAKIAENDADMAEVDEILDSYLGIWREFTRFMNLRYQLEKLENKSKIPNDVMMRVAAKLM